MGQGSAWLWGLQAPRLLCGNGVNLDLWYPWRGLPRWASRSTKLHVTGPRLLSLQGHCACAMSQDQEFADPSDCKGWALKYGLLPLSFPFRKEQASAGCDSL